MLSRVVLQGYLYTTGAGFFGYSALEPDAVLEMENTATKQLSAFYPACLIQATSVTWNGNFCLMDLAGCGCSQEDVDRLVLRVLSSIVLNISSA